MSVTRGPYVITLGDRAGVFHEEYAPSFDLMVLRARELREQHPSKVFVYGNTDLADFGENGLTDAEHEALEELGL